MLSTPGFPDYLGWLGMLVGVLWIVNVFTKMFFPIYSLSVIVLFTFLFWVFLTGLRLIKLAA
ncbi:MAG TPA: hypothetical protein ACFYD2_09255 [Candidatus Avalokitesvara rifleensis]|uniref:hypothetical protein n=1 Tax=Candidatus Avalokitesvara rifleensis TaxID=3367620 RepID=UPI00271289E0|nr:hypothetical protein [Candidatus Brocadiales bacterium]